MLKMELVLKIRFLLSIRALVITINLIRLALLVLIIQRVFN